MGNFFKHLLLPFTALLWYFICHYVAFGVFVGLTYIFVINWFYFILFYLVFIGLISALFTIPSIANYYLLNKLYSFSWLSLICHSLAGVLGVFSYLKLYYGGDSSSLSNFWDVSWLRTILLGIPAFGVITGMVWSLGISPILLKMDINK